MRFKTNLKLKTNIVFPVPLVDIILQTIIFFILASQFIGMPGLMLDLPSVGATGLYKKDMARIAITDKKLFFRGEEVTLKQFEGEMGKGLISMLVIEADKNVPYSRVVQIIDMAQHEGISKIAIATGRKI